MKENQHPILKYHKVERIASGSYGIVYLAIDQTSGRKVAMKKLLHEVSKKGIPSYALREISLLQELQNHPNIVSLLETIIYKKRIYLIFEFVDFTLRQLILQFPQNEAPFSVKKNIIRSIIMGVNECHKRKIMHRDLKPSNILITQDMTVKIADFGLARVFQQEKLEFTSQVSTFWYKAPELLFGIKEYSPAIDIWAIGCIFAEIFTSEVLFQADVDSEIAQIFRIFRTLGTPDERSWPEFNELAKNLTFPQCTPIDFREIIPQLNLDGIDLLKKMLELNPKERIPLDEALLHPFFQDNFELE